MLNFLDGQCIITPPLLFLAHESLIMKDRPWYLYLHGKLFMLLQRNALRAQDQFEIPPNRVIELGSQVDI